MNTEDHEHEKGFKTLTLDIETYLSLLDNPQLSEDQRAEFIETLWAIVVQFIDWGYGIHPVQQTKAGQIPTRHTLAQLIGDYAETQTTENKEKTLEGAQA